MSLIGQGGKILYKVTNEELIREGISAKTYIIFFAYDHHADRNRWESYHKVYREQVVENPYRQELIHELNKCLLSHGLNTTVMIRYKEHGQKLIDDTNYISNPVLFTGNLDQERRRELLTSLGQDVRTMYATCVLDVGVSTPNISGMIIADAGKAAHQNKQRIGRGMRRKTDGQNVFIVVDIQDRCMFLNSSAKQRRYLWEKEKGLELREVDSVYQLSQTISQILGDK